MPETTRIRGGSPGIGVGPPALQQCLELLAIGTAKNPHERKIDNQSRADDRHDSCHAMADGTGKPAAKQLTDADQDHNHCCCCDQLTDQARRKPFFDPEMSPAIEQDVEDYAVQP